MDMNNVKREKLNKEIVSSYHNVLSLEEIKRKYSRTTTSFRGRNLMEYIYKEGKKSAKDIADFLKITRASTTSLLDKLESLDYIKRTPSLTDERSIDIDLTRKGRLVTVYQLSHRDRILEKVLSEFDEKEKETLLKGFERLNEVLLDCEKELGTTYKEKEEIRSVRKEK